MSSSQEIYEVKDYQLIMRDPELGLDWVLPFALPSLPQEIHQGKVEGSLIVFERDEAQQLRAAFLTTEGKRHGQCRLFYSDGSVEADLYYQWDQLHGPSIFYTPQGKVLSRTFFCEGKREGKVYFYYASGQRSSVQRFRNGQWEGMQEYFYESGQVKSLLPYRNGKLEGKALLYWDSPQLKRSTEYCRGQREGKDLLWDEQGILVDEGEYRIGKPCGVHRHRFSSGQVKEELQYHTPQRFDRKVWDEKGECLLEGIWKTETQYIEKSCSPQGMVTRKGHWDGNQIRWQ